MVKNNSTLRLLWPGWRYHAARHVPHSGWAAALERQTMKLFTLIVLLVVLAFAKTPKLEDFPLSFTVTLSGTGSERTNTMELNLPAERTQYVVRCAPSVFNLSCPMFRPTTVLKGKFVRNLSHTVIALDLLYSNDKGKYKVQRYWINSVVSVPQ